LVAIPAAKLAVHEVQFEHAPAATGATKTRTAEVEAVATEMARPAFKGDGVGHIFPFFSATAGRGDGNKPEKMQQVSSAS
jgi:hypothetical protein